jgi:uncharacterized membrane protein
MDRILKKIVWLILAAPAIYLALVWKKMPEKVAMHFDLSGKPDRMGNRQELLTMMIILIITNLIIYLILTNIYRIDPKRSAAENKTRLHRLAFGVVVFMSAMLFMILYSSSHGNVRFSMNLVLAAMGLLFAFIGNYMHNIKPNYFAGFRLPWTLENEENWRKTHALGGKLWFGGGLLLGVTCIFLPSKIAMVVFFIVMGVITLIPIVYSYRLYKKQKALTSTNQ